MTQMWPAPAPAAHRPDAQAAAAEAVRAEMRAWLHDRVLQLLEYAAAGGYAEVPDVDELRRVVRLAADEVRAFVDGDPPASGARDLGKALAAAARDARVVAGGLRIRLVVGPLALPVAPELAEALAGAVREALVNAAKHAQASLAVVRCAVAGGVVVVTVEDDGAGFDPAAVQPGCGLSESIGGRLERVGGRALVESAPGDGTRVTLSVPLTASPAGMAA